MHNDSYADFAYGLVSAEAPRTMSLSLSPAGGNPDMYVCVGDDYPRKTHFTWEATATDLLRIKPSDPGYVANATYSVGVYGAAESVFAITAATDGGTSGRRMPV